MIISNVIQQVIRPLQASVLVLALNRLKQKESKWRYLIKMHILRAKEPLLASNPPTLIK